MTNTKINKKNKTENEFITSITENKNWDKYFLINLLKLEVKYLYRVINECFIFIEKDKEQIKSIIIELERFIKAIDIYRLNCDGYIEGYIWKNTNNISVDTFNSFINIIQSTSAKLGYMFIEIYPTEKDWDQGWKENERAFKFIKIGKEC